MSEAHNPSRSVSGTVCVFVFGTIFVIMRIIVLHLKVTNLNGQLWYPLLQGAVLVHLSVIFVPKGFCGLDLRVKA